ncbi:MAG: glycosyltransferase [Candidatus Omnitrophica bacterium]|nr:glycosyltransferase [Candidatus Omnitrophota bacterium]
MQSDKPLVSIGLNTYYGERFIGQTLDSFLAQDYPSFEIIILDNQSQDKTEEICRGYAARDNRFRYERSPDNLGTVKGYNRLSEMARGPYFMWADDHDLRDSTYISKCQSLLEESEEAVLAYTQTMLIDEDGRSLGRMPGDMDTRGMSPAKRHRHLIWNLRICNMIYGLMRRDVLNQTAKFKNIWGPDHLLLAELALVGAFALVPEPLFHRRQIREEEPVKTRVRRVMVALDPGGSRQRHERSYFLLLAELCGAHLKLVGRSSLGPCQKIGSWFLVLLSFGMRLFMPWPRLVACGKKILRIK